MQQLVIFCIIINYIFLLPLAINDEGNQYVTFDHTKLLQCKQVASFQICSNFDSTWSLDTIDQSCLGVIYTFKTKLIPKNCPIAPVKLEKQVRKMSENTWLLFSPIGEKVTWRCSDSNNFRTFKEKLVFKYQMFHMNKNCHAKFGEHHFSTSATLNQDHIEANIEYHPMTHLIPNDFSLGVFNDDKLEEMFKIVEMQEKEAPKTLRKAEEIIKEMTEFKFVGGAQFQSFWSAFSHIIFFVVISLGGLLLFYVLVQNYIMKSEMAVMKTTKKP